MKTKSLCLILAGSAFLLALTTGCNENREPDQATPPPAPRTAPSDRGAVQPGTPANPPVPAPGQATPPAPNG